jgi:hypothetical protein
VNKAAPKKVAAKKRAAPKKINVVAAVAPQREEIVIRTTNAAYHAGFLTAIQQTKHILSHKSKSFGEALDQLHQIEAASIGELNPALHAEIKARRVQVNGRNILTVAHPEGPRIALVPPPAMPAVADAAPAETKAPSTPAKAAKAVAPAAKRTRAKKAQ